MSNFVPQKGQLFYVRIRPRQRQVIVDGGALGQTTIQKITSHDRSYREEIFRCIGRDDTHLVGKNTSRSYSDRPTLLEIEECEFRPVGPDVALAMGLALDDSTN